MNDLSSAQPTTVSARTRAAHIEHIALDLRFDERNKRAAGTARLRMIALTNTDHIALDAAHFEIESVRLTNSTAASTSLRYTYDGSDRDDALRISLNRTYKTGEVFELEIIYKTKWCNESDAASTSGSTGKGLRWFGPTTTDPRKRRQIWSYGEPGGNRFWFPSYDAPNALRTFEIKATVDAPLMAIGNGKLVSGTQNADRSRTFHWKLDTPQANHRTTLVIGEYVDVSQSADDIKLANYAYPDEVQATKDSVERLPDMVRYFGELTGLKFPYEIYSQVFVQDFPWGMAGSGMSIQTENMVDDFGTHADFLYLWDGLEAESLAHQWFGNLISHRDWRETWLSRAFARHLDGRYTQYKNGYAEYLLWYHNADHTTVQTDWSDGLRWPIVPTVPREFVLGGSKKNELAKSHTDAEYAFVTGNTPYARGALVLHMLRRHLGDERWQRVIQHYVRSHAGKLVTTNDLRNAIEDAAGETLDWFFDQWVYRTGHPIFELTQSINATRREVTLNVKQTQSVDPALAIPQTALFRGFVDVEIVARAPAGVRSRVERRWLDAKAENALRLTLQADESLVFINFDYERTWIKEVKQARSPEEWVEVLRYSCDELARLAAMTELSKLAKENPSAGTSVEFQRVTRDIIESDVYWRIRFNTTNQLRNLLAPATETKPVALDAATRETLVKAIKRPGTWTRSGAIHFLGMTRDPQYVDLYLSHLRDPSDRVINAAAIALGRSGSPKAYQALVELIPHPSWKNQSLISALAGFKELRDPRAFDIALDALTKLNAPRWTLATPIWDYRLAAAEALVAIGKSDAAFPAIEARLKAALVENDINDIFSNVLLLVTLGDKRALPLFASLRERFKDDANALKVVKEQEEKLNDALKKL